MTLKEYSYLMLESVNQTLLPYCGSSMTYKSVNTATMMQLMRLTFSRIADQNAESWEFGGTTEPVE